MKIVQIEDFFHPDAGYQVNIISKYFAKAGHEVTVIVANMDKIPEYLTFFFGKDHIEEKDLAYEKKYGVKIIRVPARAYISGRVWYRKEIFELVDRLSPDVLYVHGNDTLIAMQVFCRLKKLHYPVVSDSHMVEMASENRFRDIYRVFYKRIIAKKIIKNHIIVIRTTDSPYVEKCLGIPLTMCPVLSFGSDLMLFHPDENKKKQMRESYGISDDAFVVVYAGKLDQAKGGKFLARTISKKISDAREIVFLIVGNAVGEYGAEVERILSSSENRIIRVQSQKYEDLPKFYQAADIAAFAKQCSLSFFDVQACGLPVVFENNSINEKRCIYHNAITFKAGDEDDFREKIQYFANMDKEEFEEYADNARKLIEENYSYEKVANQYLEILEDACKRYKEFGAH